MAKYYSDFIELSPGYESVVDATIESRDREFWTRYIVHDDMVAAVDIISRVLKRHDDEQIRHFWLSGTYGTGKTYSAIVLKHLLEDETKNIEAFLKGNPLFADVRDRFLAVRKKAPYLVIWKSGEAHRLNTSDSFLMELENVILNTLKERGIKYTGGGALLKSVQKRFEDFKSFFEQKFNEGMYPNLAEYNTFDEFYQQVQGANIDACSLATGILREERINLAADKETFKAWLCEIFEMNPDLKKSGIFIIWDEFTDYIRCGYDVELLQDLSEFAKTIPFYILYVIHEYPNMISTFDPSYLNKINARFHKIAISLSDKTTFKLIGETLKVRPGMESAWKNCCNKLYDSIKYKVHDFLPDAEGSPRDLQAMFPIHPMTVALISKTAGNFAAANRSIFRFMKDEQAEEQQAGFRYFIRHFGPDAWPWVTPDYLWDYFFVAQTHDAQNREMTPQAEECMAHYQKSISKITDSQAARVFKCCMLLRATLGGGRNIMRKSAISHGLKATKSTLENCFYGQLSSDAIEQYLDAFAELNILAVTNDRGDKRFDIPYAGNGDEFKSEFKQIADRHSLHEMISVKGAVGMQLFTKFLPEVKPVVNRLELCPCFARTTSLNEAVKTLKGSLEKASYKFGILLIVASTEEEVAKANDWALNTINVSDDPLSERLVVAVLKTLFPESEREQWLTHTTQANLARKSGNSAAANSELVAAETLVSTWVTRAVGKELIVFAHGSGSGVKVFNNNAFVQQIEKIVFNRFPWAPETVCSVKTLYKKANIASSRYGVWHIDQTTKDPKNTDHSGFTTQYQGIVDALMSCSVWPYNDYNELLNHEADYSKAGRSVLELCKFINNELVNSSVVELDELWSKLQNHFGYYNNLLCSYLLGFAFRFYVNAPYSWYDGANSHAFTEDSIPNMIDALCSGKVIGQRISIGNKQEQRFRIQTMKIFKIAESDAGNEDQCRKNLRIKITRCGYPLWTLNFLPEDAYSEISKASALEVIDAYQCFIGNIGEQSILMEQIVSAFKGPQGKQLQKWIFDSFNNRDLLNSGMQNFIAQKSPETASACATYNFTVAEMFTMFRQELQEEIWQWQVDEVAERLHILGLDMKLVGLVNAANKGTDKSVERIRKTFSEFLRNIKVPLCVFEKVQASWLPTLYDVINVSINAWPGLSIEQKQNVIAHFESELPIVLDTLRSPIETFTIYLNKNGFQAELDEIRNILNALHPESYNQSEDSFLDAVKRELSKLEYNKLVAKITARWKQVSGHDSVSVWETAKGIPVAWLYPDFDETFGTLRDIERKHHCDHGKLELAEADLSTNDFEGLQDSDQINDCLLEHIAPDCKDILLTHMEALKQYLRQGYSCAISTYRNNTPQIQQLTKKFITEKLLGDVVKRVNAKLQTMNDGQLRSVLQKILQNNNSLYVQLLEED